MQPIEWIGDGVRLVDQRLLPHDEVWVECRRPEEFERAIKEMLIRGAPAIGICAAYGLAATALQHPQATLDELRQHLKNASRRLSATRPTAVNLFWALERMASKIVQSAADSASLAERLLQEARLIHEEDIDMCRRMGEHGAALFDKPSRVLTHCNAGALATGDYGTALGVLRSLHRRQLLQWVWVDETRPFLQGARLTAYELMKDDIPCRLICDNMAGHFMQRGQVDAVIVGADRITRAGDVANKIGTSTLAVLCKEYRIPFYVAAPWSTVDMTLESGWDIPIEERAPQEVTHLAGMPVAPEGVEVSNPAFDVTFHTHISAIVTERGVLRPPFAESIQKANGLGMASPL